MRFLFCRRCVALSGLVVLALVGLARPALAQSVISTFDLGDEGWSLWPSSDGELTWNPVGGNPDGHIEIRDKQPDYLEAIAPAAFTGDHSAFDGGFLSVDLVELHSSGGAVLARFGTVEIHGTSAFASKDIVTLEVPLATTWATFYAPLLASEWGVSEQTWNQILSNIVEVRMVVDSLNHLEDQIGFDNFQLGTCASGGTTTINFESLGSVCPIDNQMISDELQPWFGVTFGLDVDEDGLPDPGELPRIELVGDTDPDSGFYNQGLEGLADIAGPGFEARLGTFSADAGTDSGNGARADCSLRRSRERSVR